MLIDRTLPEGTELPIDPGVVRPLLRAALEDALAQLRPLQVETTSHAGYTSAPDGGIRESELALPDYDRPLPGLPSQLLWGSPAAKALTDYIWSRSALKKGLSRLDGEGPTQDDWASFTWDQLVLATLRHLAKQAATEDLTLRGAHIQWRIDANELDTATTELVGLLTKDSFIVTATCPVAAVHLDEGVDVFEMEPGVVLAKWVGQPEQAVFMTRHGQEYRRGEGVWNTHVLRIRMSVRTEDDPVAVVAGAVDRVKWALMIASNRGTLVHEFAIVVESATGHARDVIRRGSPNFGVSDRRADRPIGWLSSKGWQFIQANKVTLQRAHDLLGRLTKVTATSSDFSDVMWAFGRSCTAPSSRDALLDAVIGLERLLVSGSSSEIGYRFRLHGQAILAAEGDIFDELRDLYSLRSGVAHGGRRLRAQKEGVEAAGARARFLLAKAIESAAALLDNGQLTLGKENDVGAAVADMVRLRVSRRDKPPK